MKAIFKQSIPYLAAVFTFVVLSLAYFAPSIFEGKTLYQTDIRKGYAMGQDLNGHHKETGEQSLWASRMFSGMPAYQIAPSYDSASFLRTLRNTFEGWMPYPSNLLFGYMFGFFILLIALKVNPWLSIVGAVAYAFSSYFLLIIEAGHIWKVCVLELIPPTLAGIVWAYRGKYIAGGLVAALFFALQLYSNHVQMTYYFLLFVGIFVICRLIDSVKNKQSLPFLKATAVLIVAALIGFGANATNMLLSQKYAEQTIRGKSELTASANSVNQTSGLDRDYVTQWSYGIGETFTLLIPHAKGGASGYMGDSHRDMLRKTVKDPYLQEVVSQQNSYWGDQPFTGGPTYVGAFVLFLFIFGLFVVKGYLKWALVTGTVFSILLSWGHHFMWLTNLFLDYFPLYNKFRAVSSILVVAELTIPLLALLTLVRIFENRRLIFEKKKEFYVSVGLTAGIALLFIVAPRMFFNFTSMAEDAAFAQYMDNPAYLPVFNALDDVRVAVFRAEAWRSVIIILIGISILYLYASKKIKQPVLVVALAALVVFDLGGVDKRYLNKADFVSKSKAAVAWEMTPADRLILEDKDPDYRVLNLTVSSFQDASTSYYHKSIGGYHAAKLRRYQELIDHHLVKMNRNVINMLNTRYLIVPGQNNVPQVQHNVEALGTAWLVDSVTIVQNADEEMAALTGFNPRTTALIDRRFETQIKGWAPGRDTVASIKQVNYRINDITYQTSAAREQLAVFSEIYYDDGLTRWEAFIDGQSAPVIRANYVLRALLIPAGEHTVQFVFKPKAYKVLEVVSMICMWSIILGCITYLGFVWMRRRKEVSRPL